MFIYNVNDGLCTHLLVSYRCVQPHLSLSLALPCRGALVAAVAARTAATVVAGRDTVACVAAEVGTRTGTAAAEHGESSLALHVATAAVSTHRRLVAITLLAEHLVALCRQQCAFKFKYTIMHTVY